jgi:general secretion pathway protein L
MSILQTTLQGARRFLSWWGHELADLIPLRLRRWAAREGKRTVLAPENGRFLHYEEVRGRVIRRDDLDPLGTAGLPRSAGPVNIRLPRTACLVRRIELPAAARADFGQILQLDLERATPFRPADIYSDHFVEDAAQRNGKIWVRQIVVKREVLDPILQQLGIKNIRVDSADCWDETGKRGMPVNLLRGREAAQAARSGFRLVPILAACALLLAVSAVMLGLNKYQTALAQLEAETASAKSKALAVKRSLTGVEASLTEIAELRRLKAAKPPVIRIVDELTRLLPDGAWVSSLKIEGDALEVTIVAASTGDLLPVLSRSSLFTAPDLSAPVTYDPAGQSERATVRMTLKAAAPSQPAASKPSQPAASKETVGSKS